MSDLHAKERRTCQRLSLNQCMQVELPSGERLTGESLDISLAGVLLKIDRVPDNVRENQSARLFLVLHNDDISRPFPCTIIRRTDNSLGLQLDMKNAPAFGKQLTQGVLSRRT